MIMLNRTTQSDGALRRRHGLSLLELLLAILITSMITAAVASMTTAVATSTQHERERREATVRAQALAVRLSSYITPSLYVLNTGNTGFVLWLDDSRESETVHGTEVRWFRLDNATDTVELYYVKFPEGMSQAEKDTYDVELPKDSNWWKVVQDYAALGFIDTIRLCDGVNRFKIEHDTTTEQGKRMLTIGVDFQCENSVHTAVTAASIREYKEPIS